MSAFKKQCTYENFDTCFLSKRNFVLSIAAVGRRTYEQRGWLHMQGVRLKIEIGYIICFSQWLNSPYVKRRDNSSYHTINNVID